MFSSSTETGSKRQYILTLENLLILYIYYIISIDEESANDQQAKSIGANFQPYWIKQSTKLCIRSVNQPIK